MTKTQDLVGGFAEMIVGTLEPSELWPAMLRKVQQVVGFDAGYIAASWGSATEGRGAVAEHDAAFLRQNLGRYLAEIRAEEVALYTDRARVHHDVWPLARQQELAVFRELLIPTGMKHMLVRTSVRRGNVAGFNLERRSDKPFTERELLLVDLIAPFLHVAEVMTRCSHDDSLSDEFAREHHLTKRENQLVALAARGLQNTEIALLMGVSSNTVRNTLVRIYLKVGVANRAELAYLATRPGVPPASTDLAARARQDGDGLLEFKARVARASSASVTQQGGPSENSCPTRIEYTWPSAPSPSRHDGAM
jgi:DNA-binding CsgD family transcriptional regulator